MKNFDKETENFLERYEANANVGSAEEIVEQFADVFMAADPSGARAVPSSVLLMAIPQRSGFLRAQGAALLSWRRWSRQGWMSGMFC